MKKLERLRPKIRIFQSLKSKDRGLSHQLQERASTASWCSNRAETTSGLGTSLYLVRCGWPGSFPLHNSVLEFGGSTTNSVQVSFKQSSSSSKVKTLTSNITSFSSKVA